MNIDERLAEVKARWQVFLNVMEVPYREPLIAGTRQFPGFYLLWQDSFLLVDHENATHLDRERRLARLSGKAVFTLTMPPAVLTCDKVGYGNSAVVVYPAKRGDNYYLWCDVLPLRAVRTAKRGEGRSPGVPLQETCTWQGCLQLRLAPPAGSLRPGCRMS